MLNKCRVFQILPLKKRLSGRFRFKKVRANKAGHIISNIVLVFGMPKEEQTKCDFLKNNIIYLIKFSQNIHSLVKKIVQCFESSILNFKISYNQKT